MFCGCLRRGPHQFVLEHVRCDRADDAGRDAVLQVEQVAKLALVLVGPDDRAGFGIAELGRDPQPAGVAAHRAVQHVAHAERLADRAHVDLVAAVAERRAARDHEQLLQPGERVDDVVDDAIGEICLLRVLSDACGTAAPRSTVGCRRPAALSPTSRASVPLHVQGEHADRAGHVVQIEIAEIHGADQRIGADLRRDPAGHRDAAGFGIGLQPGRNIHRIAVDVASSTMMSPTFTPMRRLMRRFGVSPALGGGDGELDLQRTGDRRTSVVEDRQRSVAGVS